MNMSQNSFSEFMDAAQNRAGCFPFYDHNVPLKPEQSDKPLILSVAVSVATQQEYSEKLILIHLMGNQCMMAEYMENMLVNEPKYTENIAVQSPPKHILASIKVELSPKDFRRRLPKPVILLDSEVEQ
jgi:hypothetical protein